MLPFEAYSSMLIAFLAGKPYFAAALGLALLVFLYKKPVECVKAIGIVLLIVVVLYIMTLLSESGSMGEGYKTHGLEKSEQGINPQ